MPDGPRLLRRCAWSAAGICLVLLLLPTPDEDGRLRFPWEQFLAGAPSPPAAPPVPPPRTTRRRSATARGLRPTGAPILVLEAPEVLHARLRAAARDWATRQEGSGLLLRRTGATGAEPGYADVRLLPRGAPSDGAFLDAPAPLTSLRGSPLTTPLLAGAAAETRHREEAHALLRFLSE